jgi:hypothetical protein
MVELTFSPTGISVTLDPEDVNYSISPGDPGYLDILDYFTGELISSLTDGLMDFGSSSISGPIFAGGVNLGASGSITADAFVEFVENELARDLADARTDFESTVSFEEQNYPIGAWSCHGLVPVSFEQCLL